MGLLRAFARWGKAFLYLLTGNVDIARKSLDAKPVVMKAKYDEIIESNKKDIKKYMDAVGSIMTIRAQKVASLKTASEELTRLENQKAGAIAMATKLANGRTSDQIQLVQQDWMEYQKCKMFHHDFSTTADAKRKYIEELKASVAEYDKKVADHTVTLTQLQKNLTDLKVKAADNVARIIGANRERALNEMIAGLSTGSSRDAEIARMDEMVQEAEAGAQISGTFVGTDANRLTAQFEAAASEASANDEFDTLVGTKPTQPILSATPKSDEFASSTRIMGSDTVTVNVKN